MFVILKHYYLIPAWYVVLKSIDAIHFEAFNDQMN